MKAFGIFEGGGAKGLSHVGALAAIQEIGIKFVGLAGASAGSIVAVLIAVGYRANELYDEEKGDGIFGGNFAEYFGLDAWNEWTRFTADLKATFVGVSPFKKWWRSRPFYNRWEKTIDRIVDDYGFFDTAAFEAKLDGLIRSRCEKIPAGQERVLFKDLDPNIVVPLRIIASDIERRAPVIFSRENTPDTPVARAVAASIAIPFLFKPIRLVVDGKERILVDGGLVSNFPVWIFDRERRHLSEFTPTLGFRLVEKPSDGSTTLSSPLQFCKALLDTALDANTEIHASRIDDLFTFSNEVAVGTFDFNISRDTKRSIYRTSKNEAGYALLRELGPQDPAVMFFLLRQIAEFFLRQTQLKVHLRVNLAMPTPRQTLRLVAGYNMKGDADDHMEFELDGGGACAECWNKRKIVVTDVKDMLAGRVPMPGLTKYQKAQVRPTLSVIMSIPVFDPTDGSNQLIGVLNIDSDDAPVHAFAEASAVAADAGKMCADALKVRLSGLSYTLGESQTG